MPQLPKSELVEPFSHISYKDSPDNITRTVQAVMEASYFHRGTRTGLAVEVSRHSAGIFWPRLDVIRDRPMPRKGVQIIKSMIKHLAVFSASGKVSVVVWPNNHPHTEVLALGDLTAQELRRINIDRMGDSAQRTRLLPTLKHLVEAKGILQQADALFGIYVFVMNGPISDLESVATYSMQAALDIKRGERRPFLLFAFLLGDHSTHTLQAWSSLNDIDIWHTELLSKETQIVSRLSELLDRRGTVILPYQGTILDDQGGVVEDFQDSGLPAEIEFSLSPSSEFFLLRTDTVEIKQPLPTRTRRTERYSFLNAILSNARESRLDSVYATLKRFRWGKIGLKAALGAQPAGIAAAGRDHLFVAWQNGMIHIYHLETKQCNSSPNEVDLTEHCGTIKEVLDIDGGCRDGELFCHIMVKANGQIFLFAVSVTGTVTSVASNIPDQVRFFSYCDGTLYLYVHADPKTIGQGLVPDGAEIEGRPRDLDEPIQLPLGFLSLGDHLYVAGISSKQGSFCLWRRHVHATAYNVRHSIPHRGICAVRRDPRHPEQEYLYVCTKEPQKGKVLYRISPHFERSLRPATKLFQAPGLTDLSSDLVTANLDCLFMYHREHKDTIYWYGHYWLNKKSSYIEDTDRQAPIGKDTRSKATGIQNTTKAVD